MLRNLFLFLFFSVLAGSKLVAQECFPLFKAEYGGAGNDETTGILYTADKGSIVIGRTTSGTPGDFDAFLLKLTETGAISWSKKFRFNGDEEFNKIKESKDGNFFIIGKWTDASTNEERPFLLKTTAEGNPIWTKELYQQGRTQKITDLLILSDNTLVLTCNQNEATAAADALILNIDQDGNTIWTRKYDGGKKDRLECIMEKQDSLLIGGQSQLESDLMGGVLLKLNKATGELWKRVEIRKQDTYVLSKFNENLISLHPLADGGMYFGLAYKAAQPEQAERQVPSLFNGKITNDGKLFVSMFDELPMEEIEDVGLIPIRVSSDSSIVYLTNGPYKPYMPNLIKNGRTGINSMVLRLGGDFETSNFYGLDTVPGNGYIIGGHFLENEWDPANNNNIRVWKVNQLLSSGDCSSSYRVGFSDSTSVRIKDIPSVALESITSWTSTTISWVVSANPFSLLNTCNSNYCLEQTGFPEQCNKNFHLTMKGLAGTDLTDIVRTSDGSLMSVGKYNNFNYFEPLIIKLNQNGTPAFTKILSQYPRLGNFTEVMALSDGNFIAAGTQYQVLDHYAGSYTILTKFNSNGDILWFLQFDNYADLEPEQLIELENGDILLSCTQNFNFNLFRINSSGNVIWKKEMGRSDKSPKMVVEGNSIYVTSFLSISYGTLSVQRIDFASGSIIWQKNFSLPDQGLTSSSLSIKQGKLYINYFRFRQINFQSFISPGLLCLDMNGNQISNFWYPSINGYPFDFTNRHLATVCTETNDGNFLLVYTTRENGLSHLQATKFQPDGIVLWSRKFNSLSTYRVSTVKKDGSNFLISGLVGEPNSLTDLGADRSFIISLSSEGKITENATASCMSTDVKITGEPADFFEEFTSPPGHQEVKDANLLIVNKPYITILNGKAVTTIVCRESGVCNSLQLEGESKICDLGKEYTFTLTKNQECSAMPQYLYDSTAIQLIDTTATTSTFLFKKAGNYSITAKLETGCQLLESVLDIIVTGSGEPFSFGPDSTICSGTPLVLRAPKFMSSYQWQNNSVLDSLIADRTGTYSVTMKDFCDIVTTASIQLNFPSLPPIQLGADSSICEGDAITLTAIDGYLAYKWNTTETTQSIQVQKPGTYMVEATHESGCISSDTLRILQVFSRPQPALGNPVLCDTGSIRLGLNGYQQYLWSTGATTSSIEVEQVGTYWLRVTDQNGCSGTDTVYLVDRIPPAKDFLPQKLEVCKNGGKVEIKSNSSFTSYNWNTGATTNSIIVSTPGLYYLTGTDLNGCHSTDSVLVEPIDCLIGVYFPNAFSPNGDQKNDFFKAQVYGVVVKFHLVIFNRFGEKIFETNDPTNGWDGSLRGKQTDSNNFIWTCTYQLQGGTVESKKGSLLLIR
ncbi:hypothetical protein GCM10027036_32740 [Flavihumibacter cheonanensis]|uniref:T9SS type B sorting domain-containing protein n=1 Tax=Flavihumibacter cheonanensis TaxID=1442385 RepID=UPI001EF7998A|nr:T9SS type B sorting domain-containing protein [Flavihumibacter cheonanensis]MCG7752696.1 gliding motility-associated C-terminal domain-containing protein [Flavihumibacter cheonanensis]